MSAGISPIRAGIVPAVPDPVPLEAEAFAAWLDELAGDATPCVGPTELAAFRRLVDAVQRDFGELVHQLPPHALTGVPARAAAAAVEALLEQLRRDLSDAITRTS